MHENIFLLVHRVCFNGRGRRWIGSLRVNLHVDNETRLGRSYAIELATQRCWIQMQRARPENLVSIIERMYGRTSQFLETRDGRRISNISVMAKKCRKYAVLSGHPRNRPAK